ncbi:MAG TPA: DMT family transporter [Vineibacter sp.]|nr:DMT family transporter [Vineibacter sp.]
MTSTGSTSTAQSARGIILMIVAMLTIPLVDGLAKYLTAGYSPLFLSWARYVVACTIVLPVAVAYHGVRVLPTERRVAHALRTVFLVISMTLYFLAIARIPLATAVSAYFVGPIIAVVLAVPVLKERLTARKVLSLVLGFVGALVILRPGATIAPGLLMAFGAGLFFALYIIATRQAARDSDPLQTLVFQCVIGALLMTPQAVASWTTPAWSDLLFFLGLGVFSAVGHILSIIAFRLADASTLAPLVYVELIGAAAIGYLVFHEVPGPGTVIGAALIAAGGLILLHGRRRTSPA